MPMQASASVLQMDLEDLARSADAVVVVNVRETAVRDARPAGARASSHRPDIVTDIDLRVNRVIAGDRPDSIDLTQPGGTIDGLTLVVPELPLFTPGERCVLFLDSQNRVIGGYQGKVPVESGRVVGYDISLGEFSRQVEALHSGESPATPLSDLPPASLDGSSIEPYIVEQDASSVVLAPAAIGVTSILPSKQIAGVGRTVTITGTDFGTTRGSGKVEFTDGLTLPAGWRSGTVTSWSDTSIEVIVPVNAASGPVRVTTGSGATIQRQYEVSFSATGRAFSELPVRYFINENTADMTGEAAEIRKAFDTWNSAGSNFRLAYAGSTARTAYPPGGTTGSNEIYFSSSPEGFLAVNYYWMDSSRRMIESDIIFNDDYTWAATASSTAFDVQTVALHELGHTVGLDDQYTNTWRVMGAAVWGQNRRTLSADEIAGAIYLYGPEAPPPPPPPTKPTVTSTSHPLQTEWYPVPRADLTFVSTAADGVAGYSYVLDGSATTVPDATVDTVAGSLSLSIPEGERWLHVRGVGSGGEAGDTAHYRLRTDRTSPVTTDDAEQVYDTAAVITLSPSDAVSGVQSVRVALDGAPMGQYLGPVRVAAEGLHRLEYYSIDNAGNAEPVRTVEFTVDLPDGTTPAADVARVAGSDRYVVASAVALEAFPGWVGVDDVIIASGDDRAAADPLAAAGIAGVYDAPVLLVRGSLIDGRLPASTESALAAIRSSNGGSVNVHVVGGATTIPSTVWKRLDALNGAGSMNRIAGADRYALSAEIARRMITVAGADAVPGVLVANGADSRAFFDALAVSPAVFQTGRPLLLVRPTTVPPSITSVLNGSLAGKPRAVVNAPGYVSDSVYRAVGATHRLAASTDRRLAATQIADSAIADGWLRADKVVVANMLPDALTGGSAVGRMSGVLLYTDAAGLSAVTDSWLTGNRSAVSRALVVGGERSVSEAAFEAVEEALGR